MTSTLLSDIHCHLQHDLQNCFLVNGKYDYYHYLCDGFDDRGWGCGYRTLQTICSWMNYNFDKPSKVPSIREIQNILVELEDKPKSFLNSRQWIGSFEVCLVIDKLYGVPSKIVHVKKEDNLEIIVEILKSHFEKFGSPIMMGGDVDCSSKGIMGVLVDGNNSKLLVVDPHYVGKQSSRTLLQNNGWVKWQSLNDFLSSSFYNLCLPQAKAKNK
ncbi:ufm1-specific protease 1 like protein [Danaus plexippus plexippus]|uniref:Ufm1-specific protease 1 like protein n=1 Tax=Danaus plexippus plexippus TaxID=278856 RepID=A0A212EHS1_DANPL|nr:ufm1-specific protease 1 like protein [Danaus plexippus plexippus]